jgi:hypothetical protein
MSLAHCRDMERDTKRCCAVRAALDMRARVRGKSQVEASVASITVTLNP